MIHHTLFHSCQACVHVCVYNTSFAPQTHLHIHTQDYDPQGSSLQFTDNGSMLYKGYKIGDRGVLTPDGPGPSSGLKSLSISLSHTHSLSLCLSNTENSRKTCLCAGITTADIHFHEEIGRGASSTVYRALGVHVCIYLYMYECNLQRLARAHGVSRVYAQTVCLCVHTHKQILPVPV
jgi:hypothetical protein